MVLFCTNEMQSPPSSKTTTNNVSSPSPTSLQPNFSTVKFDNNMSPVLDPCQSSKLPSGKPPIPPKKPDLLLNNKSNLTPNTKMEHPEWMSFSEKKRHFEKTSTSPVPSSTNVSTTTTTIHQQQPQPLNNQQSQKETITQSEHIVDKPKLEIANKETIKKVESYSQSIKQFQYLTPSEVERIKEEELKKYSSLSPEQIRKILENDDEDDFDEEEDHFDYNGINVIQNKETSVLTNSSDDGNNFEHRRVFRTAKSEKRYIEKMLSMGIDVKSKEYADLTPAQQKALEAAKRREWRQARLQSLEDDARRTLMQMQNNSSSKENIVEP